MDDQVYTLPSLISRKIFQYLSDHQPEMVSLLTRIIEMESPSDDKPAVDRLGACLADHVRDLGARVEVLHQARTGDHLLAHWGDGGGGVLLLGHMDTVWGLGTLAERPLRIDGERLFGPGAQDMKGGIVVGLWAIRVLRELQLFPSIPIAFLITSDEETGSGTSRPIIESEACRAQVVFVLEPAMPPLGAVKTSRKGVGDFRVEVSGRATHAGVDHEMGINAIDELAYQVLEMRQWTDYGTGTTVNVGVIGGGTRPNVVPEHARAQVDVRVCSAAEAARITAKMNGLAPHFPGAALSVKGGFDRPPMERTPAIAALFARARALAAELGFDLAEAATGGASDGNITAGMGIPTLDGMGVVGEGEHSRDEYALLSSLPQRAALLAGMLLTFSA
jgi:glutamate carboxypeptidase